MVKTIKPIHPGEILMEDFLKPLEISQYRLAMDIGVAPRRINEIVHCTRAVSVDTALRLAKYFGTSAQLWLNLQNQYDIAVESEQLSDILKNEVKVFRFAI
jgi:addiction module HigA family antidote